LAEPRRLLVLEVVEEEEVVVVEDFSSVGVVRW
jgi:hypothetical protein